MKNLTNTPDPLRVHNGLLSWSPDGKKIAFGSNRGTDPSLGETWHWFVMNADGTQVNQLSQIRAGGDPPSWSPDGKQIALQGADGTLYVANVDGSGIRKLTGGGPNSGGSWSPDSTQILTSKEGRTAFSDWLFNVINVAGGATRELTNGFGIGAWSPCGSQVLFRRGRAIGPFQLWRISADGTGLKKIWDDGLTPGVLEFQWSPDGSKVALVTERKVNYVSHDTLYVVSAHGTGAIRIAEDGASPTWSPDSRRIAFVEYSSSEPGGVFIVNADGTGRAKVPGSIGYSQPAWSPGG